MILVPFTAYTPFTDISIEGKRRSGVNIVVGSFIKMKMNQAWTQK